MWSIYYDDGSTFGDTDGDPVEAPTEGFIAAIGYCANGERYIMSGWDFYCFDEDSGVWWGMDRYGLHDRLRRNKVYAYKEGRTVTNDQYQAVIRRITETYPKRL